MTPRAKLLLVFLACAAPFVLATLAWFFGLGVSGATANYGDLIEPRTLSGPPFTELRGKWLLVTFDAAACDERCEKKLYYMRQIRRAQGKEMDRVERLWVITDGGNPRAELLAATEGMRLTRSSGWSVAFPHQGALSDHIYVADPLGNLMMRFPPSADPSRMLKDLTRLLKTSRVG